MNPTSPNYTPERRKEGGFLLAVGHNSRPKFLWAIKEGKGEFLYDLSPYNFFFLFKCVPFRPIKKGKRMCVILCHKKKKSYVGKEGSGNDLPICKYFSQNKHRIVSHISPKCDPGSAGEILRMISHLLSFRQKYFSSWKERNSVLPCGTPWVIRYLFSVDGGGGGGGGCHHSPHFPLLEVACKSCRRPSFPTFSFPNA